MAISSSNKPRNDAYSNPQYAVDKSFEVFSEKMSKSTSSLVDTFNKISANIKLEKASQKAMQDKQNIFLQKQADRVAGMTEIGDVNFDKNMNNYFQSQIDNYVKIKNGIEKGDVDPQEGAKALATINERVTKYQQAAPTVLSNAKKVSDAMKIKPGEPGAMSSLTPTAQQEILLGLAGQSSSSEQLNVNIVNTNSGGLALYNPDTDAMIDLNELINMEASGKQYFREVPSIKEELQTASDLMLGAKGARVDGTVTYDTRIENGNDITTEFMTKKQYDMVKQNIIVGGGLGALTKSKDMDIIWNDILGKDTAWDVTDDNMVLEAKTLLAEKSIKDSGINVGSYDEAGEYKQRDVISKVNKHKYDKPDKPVIDKSLYSPEDQKSYNTLVGYAKNTLKRIKAAKELKGENRSRFALEDVAVTANKILQSETYSVQLEDGKYQLENGDSEKVIIDFESEEDLIRFYNKLDAKINLNKKSTKSKATPISTP